MKRCVKWSILICFGLIPFFVCATIAFSKTPFIGGHEASDFYKNSGHLYAIDINTGEEKWRFKTENPVSSPIVKNSIVYFGTHELESPNYLFVLDANTGKRKWKFKVDGRIEVAPHIEESRVIFGSQEGVVESLLLYVLMVKTGKEKMRINIDSGWPEYFKTINAISYYGQVFKKSSYMNAFNLKTGKEKWEFETGDRVFSPVIHKGAAYFGSYDGYFYAVDLETGKEKWKLKGETKESASPFRKGDLDIYRVTSYPAKTSFNRYRGLLIKMGLPDKDISNISEEELINTFNAILPMTDFFKYIKKDDLNLRQELLKQAEQGKLNKDETMSLNKGIIQRLFPIWSRQGRRHSVGFFDGVALDNCVYFSSDGYLHAIDIEEKQEKWKFETDGRTIPTVYGDLVLFLEWPDDKYDLSIYLHALDAKTGKEKWTFRLPFEREESQQKSHRESRSAYEGLSCIAIHKGIAYCSAGFNQNRYLFSVDINKKEINWTFQAENWVQGLGYVPIFPFIENGIIYFASGRSAHVIE